MCDPTWVLVGATVALALITVVLAGATVYLAWESRQGSLRQIGVQTWLVFESRFDAKEMKMARKKLAKQLDPYDQTKHDQITEEVLELFESIGTAYNHGLLDKELAASSFSFCANYWWEAAKPYVDDDRRMRGNDDSLFREFEKFAGAMRKEYPKIDSKALKDFLDNEKRLRTD